MERNEEVVATSSDFVCSNTRVILCKNEAYLCILGNGQVRNCEAYEHIIYCKSYALKG